MKDTCTVSPCLPMRSPLLIWNCRSINELRCEMCFWKWCVPSFQTLLHPHAQTPCHYHRAHRIVMLFWCLPKDSALIIAFWTPQRVSMLMTVLHKSKRWYFLYIPSPYDVNNVFLTSYFGGGGDLIYLFFLFSSLSRQFWNKSLEGTKYLKNIWLKVRWRTEHSLNLSTLLSLICWKSMGELNASRCMI